MLGPLDSASAAAALSVQVVEPASCRSRFCFLFGWFATHGAWLGFFFFLVAPDKRERENSGLWQRQFFSPAPPSPLAALAKEPRVLCPITRATRK